MSIRVPEMPYFDIVLDRLNADNEVVVKAWSRHMHFGYWRDADHADLSIEGYVAAMEEMTRQHFEFAELTPGCRVIDVGCGLGGTIALLNEEFEGLDLVGVNVDERQLARARASVAPRAQSQNNVSFTLGDACQLPFEDNSVDVVFAVECIFHFGSRRRFFQEARRVLKPGGRLVVSEFIARGWTLPLLIGLYLPFHSAVKGTYGDSAPPVTRGGYRRMSQKTGFRMARIKDVTAYTLPNYVVVPNLMTDVAPSATVRGGFKFLEYATRLGFYSYDVLTFCADAKAK